MNNIKTKKSALDFISDHAGDSRLTQQMRDRITLIMSDSQKYKLSDLLNVIRDIEIATAPAPAPAAATPATPAAPATPAENAVKTAKKAKKPKKATATATAPTAPAQNETAPAPATKNKQFPDVIAASFSVLKRVDNIDTFGKLRKAVLDEKRELFFAFAWTSRELKKYEYTSIQCIRHPSKFDFNLDFASILHISEDKPLVIALSISTEAPYLVRDNELERDAESHMRFSNAIEFEIYEAVKAE